MTAETDWPAEWMAAAAGACAFLWAKREAIWATASAIGHYLKVRQEGTVTLAQVRAMRKLSQQLARSLRDTHGVRVNAICLHNGGGDITAKGDRFLTVYDSQSGDVLINSSEAWQRTPLSDAYDDEVIKPLLKSDGAPLVLTTAKLSKGNYLRSHYEADGVTHGVICLSKVARDVVWYISVNYKGLPEEEGPASLGPEASDARLHRAIAFSSARQIARQLSDLEPALPGPREILA